MNEDEKELARYFSDAVKKDSHPLDLFVRKIVNNILLEFCIPWLIDCLERYSEEDFHKRMADPYFDFVYDWESNHARRFKAFMLGARRLRSYYDFDSKAITERIVTMLNKRQGWEITDEESVRLYYTMEALKTRIEA